MENANGYPNEGLCRGLNVLLPHTHNSYKILLLNLVFSIKLYHWDKILPLAIYLLESIIK